MASISSPDEEQWKRSSGDNSLIPSLTFLKILAIQPRGQASVSAWEKSKSSGASEPTESIILPYHQP
jgi:hypothetical protein